MSDLIISPYSGPVSYTHLDVYKRQAQTSGAMTNNLIPYRQFTNNAYQLYDTTFVMPTGGLYYLGFRKSGANPTSDWSYYGAAFDDINLNYAPCDGPPNAGIIASAKPSGSQYCIGTLLTLYNTCLLYTSRCV